MTKIAHFISFGIGGADRAALELVRLLVNIYPNILLVYNDTSFPKLTSDQDPSQQLLDTYREFKALANMHKVSDAYEITKLPIDILHTHRSGEDMWLIPGLESISRNFKIVETNFHGLKKTAADFRIFPSKTLMNFHKIEESTTNAVVPNIVNSFVGESLRNQYKIPSETIIFGRVGRSDKSIYSSNLLKQYAKIESSNTLLLWVGRSELAERDALRYNVKNVLWIDPVSDPEQMANLYETFDVYCHVNKLGETFGNTVAESVIRGIPVASLRGIKKYPQAQSELLDSEQYCISKKTFRDLLRKYREDENYRIFIRQKNKEFGEKNLDSKKIIEKVINIYESLIA